MNPWDVFTWLMSATLGVSAVWIFGYFLRDLPGMLAQEEQETSARAREENDTSDGGAASR